MSVRHAMLFVLSNGPRHGYGIARELERIVGGGRFSAAQVYSGLRWLAEHQLIVRVAADDVQGTGPDRRPFDLSPKGAQELERWLRRPMVPQRPERDQAVVKLALLLERDPVALVAPLKRLRGQHLKRIALYRGTRDRPEDKLSLRLSSRALLAREEAEVRWIDESLEVLAQRFTPDTGSA